MMGRTSRDAYLGLGGERPESVRFNICQRVAFSCITYYCSTTRRKYASLQPCMEDDKFDNRFRIASARWAGYNYSQNGAYFVTICTLNCTRYFGEIVLPTGRWADAKLAPSAQGGIVDTCRLAIPACFQFVVMESFVGMPGHVHGPLILECYV